MPEDDETVAAEATKRMLEEHRRHMHSLECIIQSLLDQRTAAWDADVRAALAAQLSPDPVEGARQIQDAVVRAMWAADEIEKGRVERSKRVNEAHATTFVGGDAGEKP